MIARVCHQTNTITNWDSEVCLLSSRLIVSTSYYSNHWLVAPLNTRKFWFLEIHLNFQSNSSEHGPMSTATRHYFVGLIEFKLCENSISRENETKRVIGHRSNSVRPIKEKNIAGTVGSRKMCTYYFPNAFKPDFIAGVVVDVKIGTIHLHHPDPPPWVDPLRLSMNLAIGNDFKRLLEIFFLLILSRHHSLPWTRGLPFILLNERTERFVIQFCRRRPAGNSHSSKVLTGYGWIGLRGLGGWRLNAGLPCFM